MFNALYHLVIAIRGIYKVCVSFLILYLSAKSINNSVGIATDYRLDGPGSNAGGDEIFRPSRPTLGLTQPSVKWVPCLSRG